MIAWKKTKIIKVIFFSLILTATVFSQPMQSRFCYVKDEGEILERQACAFADSKERDISSFIKKDLPDLFSLVNVPLGISLAFEDVNDAEIKQNINLESYLIKDLLDQITNVDSRYRWKEENGVINVFSENDYSILETRIPEFKENEYPWKMDEILIQTKEFQNYLWERNLIDKIPDPDNKHGFMITGSIGKPNPIHKISIDLKNATVREILNEVVRKRGYGTWIYREYNYVSDGKFYQMYRLEL